MRHHTKCQLCDKRAKVTVIVPLCPEHDLEIDKILEEVRLELLAEAELEQRSPAKAEIAGPSPASETTGESFKGRTVGSEPTNVGSTPASPT